MSSSSTKQPLNGSSSLTNTPPRRQILESLRSRAPSEELRERRRRCFIASSFSKHSADNRWVLDESKSKRFTLAMREDEEKEFFQSLWNSLEARRVGDGAAKRPPSTEASVLIERCNVKDDSDASKRTSAEVARCEGIETHLVGRSVNSLLRGQQRLASDDEHGLNDQQSVSSTIQVGSVVNALDMNVVKVRGENIHASIDDVSGLHRNKGSTRKPAVKTTGISEISVRNTSDDCHSDSNAAREHCSKQNCKTSDSIQSRCGVNTNDIIAGVPRNIFEAEITADNGSPQGRGFDKMCPTQTSVLSQTDQCNEENLFPKRMNNALSYVDNVCKRNVFTQTSPKLRSNVRNNRGQPCGLMEAKGKPQRNNWYRYNKNMNDRPGDRNVRPYRRSHSCHIEPARRYHHPKAPYASQRYRTEHRKELPKNTCDRRLNIRYARNEHVLLPYVEDMMANVGCKCSSNNSSGYSSMSDASIQEECSCSTSHESSSRRPYEKKVRNGISKINFQPRRSFSIEEARKNSWSSSCCCSDFVSTSEGGHNMAADDTDGDVLAPPRDILLCSMCGVVVNSKKKMWAHRKGARHSRTAQDAEWKRQHGVGEGETSNRVVCCSTKHHFDNMLTCRMPYIEPLTLVPVLRYALVAKRV